MSISLTKKITGVLNQNSPYKISGLDGQMWHLLYTNFINYKNKNIYIFPDDDIAEKFYHDNKSTDLIFYPGHGDDPYIGINSSENSLFQRLSVFSKVASLESYTIITTLTNLLVKMPDYNSSSIDSFKIILSDIISPFDLAKKLVGLGYQSMPTVEEKGTFSSKGEIFDLYTNEGLLFRLHYFDDMIEEIYSINIETNRTDKSVLIDSIHIGTMPESVLHNSENISNFKHNMPRPLNSNRNQISNRKFLFERIGEGNMFYNYPLYYACFFAETTNLLSVTNSDTQIHFFNYEECIKNNELDFDKYTEQFIENFESEHSDALLPNPKKIFDNKFTLPKSLIDINDLNISSLNEDITHSSEIKALRLLPYLNVTYPKTIELKIESRLIDLIKHEVKKKKNIYFVYQRENSRTRFKQMLEQSAISESHIKFICSHLDSGFYYPSENSFFISEFDFLQKKQSKAKRVKEDNRDVFAEQLATLNEGDYVIHKQHGIGQYKGIETIELNSIVNDYLIIHYSDNDKVFVPVYKMNLIQKYTNSEANVRLASLKTKKFEQEKSKAKNSVKKLAFDLLEIQAKRALEKGFKFSEPDQNFIEFEQAFKFQETPDQLKSIDDVIDDMCNIKPMDRLICGDVGFGKTEVAMRASFKAVLDNKQVAILVPTTVLAFQHYNTMQERFKDFPVNVHLISRFRSPKQVQETLEKTKAGLVDILIGTHKILSSKIEFNDLGLLIVDEEQRFGVSHKEKIKSLRSNIDCLTMTATPIPRTLQLSFLGIKDFSLIKTAPPKRQSIKTYVIKEDSNTLRTAIKKELSRGGQIFIVHNRVHDIEDYTAKIKKLVPEARVVFAHGQMTEKNLESKITEFYHHKYDILVSTTIIESGIDIPNANTMIVDNANMFGLSQLHQLRGRIGRSDKKAYAYFIVPSDKALSSVAAKRLKALQTYAEIGAGFSLATSDLEIRGSGDILGAEQSGHIANVGLELYMSLLQDAIAELKAEGPTVYRKDIEVQTSFNSFIPDSYITNPGQRLRYYKKLSNCQNLVKLDDIKIELAEIYGLAPIEVLNFTSILEARILLSHLPLKSIKVLKTQIILSFDQLLVENNSQLREKIVSYFISRPKIYKMKPNFTITCMFKSDINIDTFVDFAKHIAVRIEAC